MRFCCDRNAECSEPLQLHACTVCPAALSTAPAGAKRHDPCACRVQRALEDHRNAVMLTEWESRGDDDSPATPLRLTKRDWGDSLSSARIRATSGGMELVPLGEASGSGLARVSHLTLTLHAPGILASKFSLLVVLHVLHGHVNSCESGRAIMMPDLDGTCRTQSARRNRLPSRRLQRPCRSMFLRPSQVDPTHLPCHDSGHASCA